MQDFVLRLAGDGWTDQLMIQCSFFAGDGVGGVPVDSRGGRQ